MKNRSKYLLPYIIFVVSAIALMLRARLSFCWSDESFYFSTSDRFLKGDLIFVHEWFPTQLVSFILLPFHYLFKLVVGSNDGVILYFRYLYIIFSLAAAIIVFNILKKKRGDFIALAAALFYQFYAHLNIATMSYYTLSASFFLLSMLFIYDYLTSVKKKSELVVAGICFALSVLSLPSLVAGYVLIVVIMLAAMIFVKNVRRDFGDILGFTLAGIAMPAAIVLIFTQCTTTMKGIIDNLGYVLSDEEHTTSLVYPFKNFFIAIYNVFDKRIVLAAVFLALIGLIYSFRKYAPFKDKIETAAPAAMVKTVYLLVDFGFFIFFVTRAAGHTGFIGTALLLFALPLWCITENDKKDVTLFLLLFAGGLLFSMVYSYSSQCDLYVLSIGHNVAAIGAICIIKDFITDSENRGIVRNVALTVILAALVQTMVLRFVNIYRDAPVKELNTLITEGPAKGLYTTSEHFETYKELLNMLKDCESKDKNVFITKLLPWGYLATDMKCAAHTTWRTTLDSERLMQYYEVLPEKWPQVIVVLKDEVGSYETCGDVEADPVPNENSFEGGLAAVIGSADYEKTEYKYGTVYVAK